MFRRPTARRKASNEIVSINLVPMLDALVTLIAFLLLSMSLLAIVSIESPVPMINKSVLEKPLLEKPLQLTLTLSPEQVEIWSPFAKIPAQSIANRQKNTPNLTDIHKRLIEIKQKFPFETKLILVPSPEINYDTLIAVIDVARMLDASDPPIYITNEETDIEELVKNLFPEIIFGNLLEDH